MADLRLGLLGARRHDVLGQCQGRLAVQEPLFGEILHGRAGEVLELGQQLEILLDHLNLLLQPLGLLLEGVNLHFLGADLLPSILLDGAGAVARAQDAHAVGSFGIERAVDRLRGQRRDDDLDQPLAGATLTSRVTRAFP